MSTQCAIQQCFSFRQDREVCLDFEGGQIASDAGLIAGRTQSVLRESDELIGFTQRIVDRLRDDRHPAYIVHAPVAVVIQRLYAIIAGYEDQNDADLLRHDGLFQLIAGEPDLGDELTSQPTISRFENAVSATEVGALNELLVESFIDNTERPPMLIIELDSTDDPAHGQQQLIGFNGFHRQWMYHPLVIHEGVTGCILGAFLRPGDAHSSESALIALRPIVRRLREAFPYAPISLCADSGFAGLQTAVQSEGG